MAKETTAPKYVTRSILKQELSASELRVVTKINDVETRFAAKNETNAQSLKDYTDSRFTQLGIKIDGVEKRLDAKMTKHFELMMQTFTDGNKGITKLLSNHEECITVLEGRWPQASKI